MADDRFDLGWLAGRTLWKGAPTRLSLTRGLRLTGADSCESITTAMSSTPLLGGPAAIDTQSLWAIPDASHPRSRLRLDLERVRANPRKSHPMGRGQALRKPPTEPGRQGHAAHEPLIGSEMVAEVPLAGLT